MASKLPIFDSIGIFQTAQGLKSTTIFELKAFCNFHSQIEFTVYLHLSYLSIKLDA